ncbi:transglycosylase SLT domain-containing protein [uncultured Cocleimonas sp.]|uniref:transglycosylase SLT domain-containing protein n=1 Tax=uncultured Cocleimonas sp. TaxID=1051587 RepID=UPI0026026416|nr:transglycosylase SLT domain-containing protein [uncultured Cocleimonas sp.]
MYYLRLFSFRLFSPRSGVALLKSCLLIVLFGYGVTASAIDTESHPEKYCSVGKIESFKKKLKTYNQLISKYSQKYGVSESLIKAVITAESCFNSSAVSPVGAQGLMQLMPATAARFGVLDSFDPEQNIQGGTKYLKFLLSYYDQYIQKAVAAYNAGEGAVDKYQGIPPYKETINYVSKVSQLHKIYAKGVKVHAVFRQGKSRSYRPFKTTKSRLSPYKNGKRNYARSSCFKTTSRLKRATRYVKRGKIKQRLYFAKKGDTLMKVMRKTGVNKAKIKLMNNLRSNTRLRRGQRLLLWECR